MPLIQRPGRDQRLPAAPVRRARRNALFPKILLLAAFLHTAWVHAGPTSLTLDEAVAAALAHARQLPANAARARAAQEQAVAAGQRPDPVLRLALESLPINGPNAWSTTRDFMTMRSVGIMQTLPSEAKRSARAARLNAQADAVLSESGTLASEIQRSAADTWLQARAARQRLEVLQAQHSEARREALAAEAALRSSRVPQADWLNAQDRIWQLEQQLVQRRAEEAAALDALARWTGVPALPTSTSAVTLAGAPALSDTPSLEELLARHPALQLLQSRRQAAEAAAELADLERRPDWSVEVMLSQRGPLYSDMVTLGVSVPLAWNRAQRQDRELAAALASAESVSDELLEAERALFLQLQEWQHRARAAQERLAIIDTHRLPLAQQRVEAVLASYRSGTASLADVLAARQQTLSLQLERIEAELEGERMRASLHYLLPRTALPQATAPDALPATTLGTTPTATAQETQP